MNIHEHEPSPYIDLEGIKAAHNQQEDEVRSRVLADLLFHRHIDGVFSDEEIQKIEREFLDAKKGLNMGQRMELALSPKYLGIINVVELGLTKDPAISGEVDGLKTQYHDLLDWMERDGWQVAELPRNPENRQMSYLQSPLNPRFCIVDRTRSLIETTTHAHHPIDGDRPVDVSIAKRMIFTIPVGLHEGVTKRCEASGLEGEDLAETVNLEIEKIMDGKNTRFSQKEFIFPIRTAYYLLAYPQDLKH